MVPVVQTAVSGRPPVTRFPGSEPGPALGSVGSAGAAAPLFAGFIATMAESDFFMPFILSSVALPSAIPPRRRDGMKTSQVPMPCVRACMGSQTPRDPDPSRHVDGSDAAFGCEEDLGIPDLAFVGAQ